MRSNYDATRERLCGRALAVFGLLLSVGCGDSVESPGLKGSTRMDSERDAGDRADASMGCVDTVCAESRIDDRWLCPINAMSVRTSTVRYSVRVVDFVSGMPRRDIEAKACRYSDLSCEEPVATFVDSKRTGQVQLELPTGFVGFLEVKSDAVDTLLYITKPIVEDTRDRDITVPTLETIDLLASLLEYTWDMDKGLVVLEVLDCSDHPQSGIHFECREGGDGFYMVNGIPFKTEHMTMYDEESNTAEGGFINVPPGLVQFTTQLGIDADAMQLGSLNAQVRPRTLTIIEQARQITM